ncbi:MAG: hypothetical protein Q4F72_07360 [Desulfovibrionaceae bacterium]|nr:hypothetical protein [Desulfovibrionaceae bacterium]
MGKPSKLEMLSFVRYVRSFIPGRVRVRHPALTNKTVGAEAKSRLEGINGISSVELNTETGSALIIYDANVLSQDMLIEEGIEWARWLNSTMK